MLEAKLQLLSILSSHTADRSRDPMPVRNAERVREYSDMFNLIAHDVMNTLYASEHDVETTGDAMHDLERACEDAGVDFIEVKRHGISYLNLLVQSSKIDYATCKKLVNLYIVPPSWPPGDE